MLDSHGAAQGPEKARRKRAPLPAYRAIPSEEPNVNLKTGPWRCIGDSRNFASSCKLPTWEIRLRWRASRDSQLGPRLGRGALGRCLQIAYFFCVRGGPENQASLARRIRELGNAPLGHVAEANITFCTITPAAISLVRGGVLVPYATLRPYCAAAMWTDEGVNKPEPGHARKRRMGLVTCCFKAKMD